LDIHITIEDPARRGTLYGNSDHNLRLIRTAFDVKLSARDGTLHISGRSSAAKRAAQVFEELQSTLRNRADLPEDLVHDAIDRAKRNGVSPEGGAVEVFLSNTTISPRTDGQRQYMDAILESDLTFCLGPAGTGKTFLAVAVALSMLKSGKIKRIVLARPAVEAGEKLGYLPGDLQAKVNPYLRPIFDAMHDMMSYEQIKRFMQNDVIEVVPLAFMRGRTLNNAVIILDEAQNATISQMMMFLTRLGQRGKMIVTGDDSQSDLESDKTSGLIDAVTRLEPVTGVRVIRLDRADIVRHPLVQDIVAAYGKEK
jgi:phosphate starvation-inducible protein PhoH and related proteins